MIKNIVFDMGNVVTRYESDAVCRRLIEDPQIRERTAVFVSPEWFKLDMGIISEEAALKQMQARLATEKERELAARCFESWHLYNMRPFEGMEELVGELKEAGFGIYLCSNASVRLLGCYRQVIAGIQYFDGVLFSAEVKCMKPQREMYEHLYRRFGLKPQECFFVDDLPENIEGGRATGMDGYCFADGDVGRLREALGRLNR